MKTETTYGEKIRKFREKRAWTQEQLAEATGFCTPRTIQRLERNETQGRESLQAVAGALDVDLEQLETVRFIPERFLAKATLVTTARAFVDIETRSLGQAFGRAIMAPLPDGGQREVERLLNQIFRDRELIEPYEHELWSLYVEGIEEPLAELFEMKLAMFIIDERKDQMLSEVGGLVPSKPYIENWRTRYFAVVPLHGCFRLSESHALHRFNPDCSEAVAIVFRALLGEIPGLNLYTSALTPLALDRPTHPDGFPWCDTCFPVSSGGLRVDFEYMARVTGKTRSQLEVLLREFSGDDSLLGLS